jgi:hypothetical protein
MDLNSDAIASRQAFACCGCRDHLAVSSIGVLAIILRFCRYVSIHLAKGTEKAAAAPIADRPRDLLNRKCPRGEHIGRTLHPHLPERDHWRTSDCAQKARHE